MTYLDSNKEEPQFKKTDAKNLFKGASHFRKILELARSVLSTVFMINVQTYATFK